MLNKIIFLCFNWVEPIISGAKIPNFSQITKKNIGLNIPAAVIADMK